MLGGAADGRPAIDTDAKMAEAILALSGTTNGALAVQGFRRLEERTGRQLADLAEGSEEKRITFADTQARPVPVITTPEWSGSETGGRRYAPFTVNVERLKPWHTLTGRMHFFLDHDWMRDLGETLPIYRPPLDMHRLFGEPTLGPDGGQAGDRPLPDPALEVVDPLRVPGQPVHAVAVARRADAVDEPGGRGRDRGRATTTGSSAVNSNGVLVARAIVSHRHAGRAWSSSTTPRSGRSTCRSREATGRRGGIHNSLTRLLVKPTHLIGGYAQLSYAFNYLGPTGNQRDVVTMIRRAQPGGDVLMRVMAQMGMVMNLDKCIGCHTCSVTCKQAWTNRAGVEYVWFNNVETRPGQGYPAPLRGPGHAGSGGWTLNRRGRLTLKAGGRVRSCSASSPTRCSRTSRDYYEPWTYDYENAHRRAARRRLPGGPSRSR